jgi:hypothetical protein
MIGDKYYLSSLESTRFAPVRECKIVEALAFDTGKSAVLGLINPGVIGQDFNRSADIDEVVLASRHEGVSIEEIAQFPCFVFIAIARDGYRLQSPTRADDLEIIGWGELYRSYHDAENHVFG